MRYPNAGVGVNEFDVLGTIDPIWFRDLMDSMIFSTPYSRLMILKYPHDGFDPITNVFDARKKEICKCFQRQYGSGGLDGVNKICQICNGARVRGGWKQMFFRGFYWNTIPPGLKKFQRLFSSTLPIDRMDATIYVSATEKEIKTDRFVILNYNTELEEEQPEEFQIMNVRPVFVGEVVVWKWLVMVRHPVAQTGS
jgi:hypothetical protein